MTGFAAALDSLFGTLISGCALDFGADVTLEASVFCAAGGGTFTGGGAVGRRSMTGTLALFDGGAEGSRAGSVDAPPRTAIASLDSAGLILVPNPAQNALATASEKDRAVAYLSYTALAKALAQTGSNEDGT